MYILMRVSAVNDYEILINYFNNTHWEKFGYINFRTFANTIAYQLNTDNDYIIRKSFNTLMKLGFIERINIPKRYVYRYYNPEVEMNPKTYIIHFD